MRAVYEKIETNPGPLMFLAALKLWESLIYRPFVCDQLFFPVF